MKNIVSKKTVLLIGIILFFLSGTAYVTDAFKNYHNVILLAGIACMWVVTGVFSFRYISPTRFLNPYPMFILMVCISYLFHQETSMLVTIFGLMLLWWTTCVIMPYGCEQYNIKVETIYALLLFFLCAVLLSSFIFGEFRVTKFKGIFTNSNASGGVAATLCVVAISCYLEFLQGKTNLQKLLHFISLGAIVFSIFVALFSTSRTSVITIMAMLILMFLFMLSGSNIVKKKKNMLALFLSIIALIILGFVLYNFTKLNSLIGNIIHKFEYKTNDTLDGRMEKWQFIYERLRWFGNGEKTSIGAHNTYLSLTDQYGIISGCFWVLFVLFYSIKAFFYIQGREEKKYRYLPFFAFFCFDVISFTEGMMLKTIMLLCMFSTGILDNKYVLEGTANEQTN